MTRHMTGTREEWLAARLALLDAEKELTRRSDELARRRQELPWVPVDKAYRFEIEEGSASLADLFRGRSQLLVYHFMFGPDYAAGCPSCSAIADGFNGSAAHLASHDVTLSAVSRAPLAKLEAYKRRMGWTFPWASSFGGDFNADFNASFTEEQQRKGGVEYNYRREAAADAERALEGQQTGQWREDSASGDDGGPVAEIAAQCGTDAATARAAGHERVRARGRRRLPHLFHLFARTGRPLGHVPMARPRSKRAQRDRRLVAPPRRVRQALTPQRRADARSVVRHPYIDASGWLRLRLTRPSLFEIVPCGAASGFSEWPKNSRLWAACGLRLRQQQAGCGNGHIALKFHGKTPYPESRLRWRQSARWAMKIRPIRIRILSPWPTRKIPRRAPAVPPTFVPFQLRRR
jgi:predicted dithiol-disulfide oxidoreductase (DUF899 family)